jgi:phage terminase large subunit-like protein
MPTLEEISPQVTLENLQIALRLAKTRKISDFYRDSGPLRRELYPKHLSFFSAGSEHRERAFIAGNRVGKTEGVGGYEVTCHLTGIYPDWWEGRRFTEPVMVWAAGNTSKTVRDILQLKMVGPLSAMGTGMIPADKIVHTSRKAGIPEALELVYVEHVAGGHSTLNFKSYDQGREGFEGTEQHVIWLDEEPPVEIYGECLMRTATVQGLVLLTFTPLRGLTPLVLSFLPGGRPL